MSKRGFFNNDSIKTLWRSLTASGSNLTSTQKKKNYGSHPRRGLYANLGVLYYLVYNPEFWRRDGHQPFELYKLENGVYKLRIGEPYWMPEIGLGIGRYQGIVGGLSQEILTWYDARGDRHLSPEEQEQQRTKQERLEKNQERLAKEKAQGRMKRLEALLRSQGIDPDQLPEP